MNKPNLSKLVRSVRTAMNKHSPEILTGIGIAGMISSIIMAVRATPKALSLMEEKMIENDTSELSPVEVIKTTWTCYIPTTITCCMSIGCLIGASSVNFRRNAAIATAYTLSESALKEYQEKVIETMGNKKEQSVRDSIAKDRIDRDPISSSREIIITERGNTLCYDTVSGRYFKSDIDKLKKAENELNRQIRDDMYISLNEFYYEIGLNAIGVGDDLGWNIENGYIDLSFSSQLTEEGSPCLVIDFKVVPKYGYDR